MCEPKRQIQKRLENTKVVQKCELLYDVNGLEYKIGTISKELIPERLLFAFVFDIDKEMVDYLRTIDSDVDDTFIPGIDLDLYGYYQAFSILPFFISMRIVDPRRSDVQTYLDRYNMKEYDAFTLFMRSEGRQLDNFHVREIPVD